LNRETLYRTLSENGNPRLDTLAAILDAFGLRLSVQPAKPTRPRGRLRPAHAST
jgi:DNA-binding phage protein